MLVSFLPFSDVGQNESFCAWTDGAARAVNQVSSSKATSTRLSWQGGCGTCALGVKLKSRMGEQHAAKVEMPSRCLICLISYFFNLKEIMIILNEIFVVFLNHRDSYL